MTAPGDAPKGLSSPRWAIVLPLLVGVGALAATALAWSSVRDQEQELLKATFEYRVRDAERRIDARVAAYHMTLRAAQGAFLAYDVPRDEFRTFVEGLRLPESLPGIQGVGFAQVIPRVELDAHQASVRAEGLPDYTVHPPSTQETITSIVFLEPQSGRNLRAFGYDMYTEPVRRAAMDEARRLDDVIASGKVTLVQEVGQAVQAGFLMYLPVFGPAEEGTSGTEAPKRQLRGWVYAPFRMNDFMNGLLGERSDDLDVHLYDGETTSAESLLFDDDGDAGTATAPGQLRDTRTIEIAHHTWTMTTRSRPGMAAHLGPDRSWVVAWSGGLASLLLTALTGVLVRGRTGALALAAERQRRYDVVADSAPVLIWTSGTDALCDSFNAPWLAFTGRTLAQELGNGWTEGVHPDDFKRCVDTYLAAFHARKPFSMEYRLRHADGSWRWIVDNGVPRYLPDGAFVGYIGSGFDITERNHLRDELQRVVREQEILLDTVNVGIVMLVERRQVAVNRGMEDLFGYTRAEMVGQSTRMYYPTQEAFDAFGRAVYPELAKGLVFEIEVELRKKDGSPLWVQYNGRAVDPSDLAKGTLWVVTDRTAQRRAEETLRDQRSKLESVIQATQIGTWEWNVQTGETVFNERWAQIVGYSLEELGPVNIHTWETLSHPDDLRTSGEALERHFAGGLPFYDVEVRMRHKDGHWVWVHDRGKVMTRTADGKPLMMYGTHTDVTARHELEHQLADNQMHLEELNSSLAERVEQTVAELRAKDQLLITQSRQAAMGETIGNIAHQWRQPLNALALVLADLRDTSRFGELDGPTLEKAVVDGSRLIQKMSSTVNDFRDFLRPEKEKSAFSALAQVRETIDLLAPSFDHAGVVLAVDAPADFHLFGFANEYAQVLMNLLANAKQAIAGAGVEPGRVTVSLVAQDGFGRLTVRDNGGGIPVANLDRIFEPYFSTKDGGTGIGLYMSRQIVERSLGGRLEVRNVDGGAEFAVITPIAETPP